MTDTHSQCPVLIVLDRQVVLESLMLNRLQKIPVYRQQEWLRGLLLDGFRLACHALRMTQRSSSSSIQKGNDEQSVYEREDEQVIRQPGNGDFPSVDAISVEPVSIAFNGIKTADDSKPFAQLRKVMG